MNGPGPGWYTDPEDATGLRWWSGEAWTEHKMRTASEAQAGAQALVEEEPYVPMAGYGRAATIAPTKLTRGEKDRQTRRKNSLAYTGCVLSLLGLLINPFAVLSVLGIIFSGLGLAKSHDLDGEQVTGRGTAIAGLLVGLVGLVYFAWNLSKALG